MARLNEDRATRYHRSHRRASAAARAATGVMLALLAVGLPGTHIAGAAAQVAAASSLGWVLATALFVVAAGALVLLARLPFDLFRDWSLERRYGLERGGLGHWLAGHLRESAIAGLAAIGAALALRGAAALTGKAWWLAAALAVWVGHLTWSLAAPVALSWFGGLRPLRRAALAARLRELGRRAGAAIDVHEWRGGEDSKRAHAALAGLGRTRRIILSDTLLDTLTEPEVEVVVAHEMAHHVHHDAWRMAGWQLASLLISLGLSAAALPALGGAPVPDAVESLPLVALVAGATTLLLSPVGLALSRRLELQADAYAVRVTGNPDAFITSMRRLTAHNLIDEHPTGLARLFSSHPTIRERVLAAVNAGRDAHGRAVAGRAESPAPLPDARTGRSPVDGRRQREYQ